MDTVLYVLYVPYALYFPILLLLRLVLKLSQWLANPFIHLAQVLGAILFHPIQVLAKLEVEHSILLLDVVWLLKFARLSFVSLALRR